MGSVLEKVNQLEVKKYNFINGKERKYKSYGLIAQDVEKVFPEIVKHSAEDDNTDSYSLNYSTFGVLAIKAIQEQQKKLDAQDKKIEELTKLVNELLQVKTGGVNNIKAAAASTMLEQNAPNPFNSSTVIRYHIPASVSNAQIMVTNASGNMIKTFTLNNKGAGSVTINAGELAAGSYYYTLITDGKKADSKQMILNK